MSQRIFDQLSGTCYNSDTIAEQLVELNSKYKSGDTQHCGATQDVLSGLEIDFDFYQHMQQAQITAADYQTIVIDIMKLICKSYNIKNTMEKDSKDDLFDDKTKDGKLAVVIKKRPMVFDDNGLQLLTLDIKHNMYKDGCHVTIPEVKMTKNEKHLMLCSIQNNIINPMIRKKKWVFVDANDAVDINSKHAPMLFIGSAKRSKSYFYQPEFFNFSVFTQRIEPLTFDSKAINTVAEFAVNDYGCEKLLQKRRFDTQPSFDRLLTEFEGKNERAKADYKAKASVYEMSEEEILAFTNPPREGQTLEFINAVIDSLDSSRAVITTNWIAVLRCLSSIEVTFKLDYDVLLRIADQFSMRGDTAYESTNDVQNTYDALQNEVAGNPISLLMYYAKQDNINDKAIVRNLWKLYFAISPSNNHFDGYQHFRSHFLPKACKKEAVYTSTIIAWMKNTIKVVDNAGRMTYYVKTVRHSRLMGLPDYHYEERTYEQLKTVFNTVVTLHKSDKHNDVDEEASDNTSNDSINVVDLESTTIDASIDDIANEISTVTNDSIELIKTLQDNITNAPNTITKGIKDDEEAKLASAKAKDEIYHSENPNKKRKVITIDHATNAEIKVSIKAYITQLKTDMKLHKNAIKAQLVKLNSSKRTLQKKLTQVLKAEERAATIANKKAEQSSKPDNEPRFIDIFSYCLKNNLLDQYGSVERYPHSKEINSYDKLNLFTGFPIQFHNKRKAACFEDSIMFEHMKDVLCAGDEGLFRYLLSYIAHIIQEPAVVPGIAWFFQSIPGVGKDRFNFWLRRLLGFQNSPGPFDTPEAFFGRFNDDMHGALALTLNEISTGGTDNYSDMLKSFITRETMKIDTKSIARYETMSFARYFLFSNHERGLFIEPNDRRFVYARCAEPVDNTKSYFDALSKEINCNDMMKAAYDYLLSLDISEFDPRSAYKTQEHLDIRIKCLNSALRFIYFKASDVVEKEVDRFNNAYESANGRIVVSRLDLYNQYKSFCTENTENLLSASGLATALDKIGIPLKQHRMDNNRIRGFNITKQIIQEGLGKLLNEDSFTIQEDNEVDVEVVED